MTVTFATFIGGHNIRYSLLDATSPVIGISFLLILLRLNFDKYRSSTSSSHITNPCGASTNYPLRAISVNVVQCINVDSDSESKATGRDSYGDVA